MKNCKWVYALVLYTGKDTKIMKNSDHGRQKNSSVEHKMNEFILWIILFTLFTMFKGFGEENFHSWASLNGNLAAEER